MNFVAPAFLYALLFLAIPVLIHLFNFRKYKTIYFPQVKFLKEVKKESQSTSQLKHLVVLISRLLALASIIIAFAQPFGTKDANDIKQGKKRVQLYLDNSFSMQSVNEDGLLLESAKQKVYQIIDIYSESDEFQLLTNDFNNSYQLWQNKSEFISSVQDINFSPQSKKISQVVNRFSLIEESNFDYDLYLLTDFQKEIVDLENVDTSRKITFIPLQSESVENISLSNLKFEKPYHLANSKEIMEFQLNDFGSSQEGKSIVTQLYINNNLNTPFTVDLDKKDSVIKKVSFNNSKDSSQNAFLTIKDYPIQFDDSLFFNIELNKKITVSHLFESERSNGLKAIYKNDSLFDYREVAISSVDYNLMQSSSTIILEPLRNLSSGIIQFLAKHINEGNSVAIILDRTIDLSSYNQLFSKLNLEQLLDLRESENTISYINTDANLFQEVFNEIPKNIKLPKSKNHFLISDRNSVIKEDIFRYQNNTAALRKYKVGEGKLYLFNIPFNDSLSNFSRNAIFVPTLYNLALFSSTKSPLYYTIGSTINIQSDAANIESPYRIVGNKMDVIPRQKKVGNSIQISLDNNISKAGQYELYRGEEKIKDIALNYDRKESNYSCYTIDEFENLANDRKIKFNTINENGEALINEIQFLMKGEPYWKYFIILAVIFFAIETILIRLL